MAQHSGWYEDPTDPTQLRYWDGILWTNRTTPKSLPPAPPPVAEPSPVPSAPGEASRNAPPAGLFPPSPYAGRPGTGYGQGGPPGQTPWPGRPGTAPAPWQQGPWATPGRVAPDGTPLAAWWQRLLARVIDGIVTGVLAGVLAWPWLSDVLRAARDVVAWTTANPGADPSTQDAHIQAYLDSVMGAVVPITLIGLGIALVYEVLFLVSAGATPGKLLLGTRVRLVNEPGPPPLLPVLRRQVVTIVAAAANLVPLVSLIAAPAVLIDDAWLLWDPRRQCIHDKIAGTIVVRKS